MLVHEKVYKASQNCCGIVEAWVGCLTEEVGQCIVKVSLYMARRASDLTHARDSRETFLRETQGSLQTEMTTRGRA